MTRIFISTIMVYLLCPCNLDMVEERLLASHKKKDGGGFGVYYVEGGATAKDNIQVRKAGKNTPIWVNERYDTLLSSKLVNDTAMELVVSAKGIHRKVGRADTLYVTLN